VLAALPPDGWTPGWAMGFLAVPVIVGLGAAFVTGKVLPTRSVQVGAARGLGAGVLAAVLLGVAVSSAGGAIGPGRMAEIGAGFWAVLAAGVLPLGLGGTVGGLAATWWARRHDLQPAAHPERSPAPPTVWPLAGPEDVTEPVHLPPVTPQPLAPATGVDVAAVPEADLSTEDTVQLRLPGRPPPSPR
jgi:hypothetical protein